MPFRRLSALAYMSGGDLVGAVRAVRRGFQITERLFRNSRLRVTDDGLTNFMRCENSGCIDRPALTRRKQEGVAHRRKAALLSYRDPIASSM